MNTRHNSGAIRALLEEYEKALNELKAVIKDITPEQLIRVVDPVTKDENCISIQSILTHVVGSGFSYCIYIRNNKNIEAERPEKEYLPDVNSYLNALEKMFEYTCQTFDFVEDNELEVFINENKILTRWGQLYDIEQMMEHAIVHILRHRRQIERFKQCIIHNP